MASQPDYVIVHANPHSARFQSEEFRTFLAGIAILSVIGASWLTPRRMNLKAITDALALGSRNMITTGLLLVAVGLVVNVIAMTGVGNTLSLMIQQWAGGSLVIALVLVALASLVLGMGLPVTAAYIVLATLSAPALYNLIADAQLVELIAAGQALPESVGAMLMLWIASDWPLHDISDEYLYSAHMLQHMMLSYFLPGKLAGGGFSNRRRGIQVGGRGVRATV